jgi:sulfide:quinone oxidoreductase
MGKTVLILGGGMGGVVAANKLRAKLPAEHKIILIDRSQDHFFYPSLLWVLDGGRTPAQIVKRLDRLNRRGIIFRQAAVQKIDLAGKKVLAGGESFSYDYLVIALGAELNYAALPGLAPERSLFELSGILAAKEKLKTFTGGKVFVVVAGAPFRCPAAPYEAAMILNDIFRKKSIRDKVDLRLFTVEDQPMPVAGVKIGAAVRAMIEAQDIKYLPKYKLTSVDEAKKEIVFENGEKHNFDLLLIVPPHKAPDVIKEAGLLGETGWLPINANTLATKTPGVFAIGDITGVKLLNGKALPKAGVFAHFEAEVAAKRIAEEISGKIPTDSFKGGGSCFLEVGGGRAGLAFGDFYGVPDPKVTMLFPLKLWHWAKILFEKWWFWKWF